jgi:hypothetical protein
MTTSGTVRPTTVRSHLVVMITLRVVGALLLLGMAWIHYHLWNVGYNTVSLIGPLFLVNAIVGVALAVAVCVVPNRMLGIASSLSSLFTLGTLAALVVSLFWGLFGFHETVQAPLLRTTLFVEALGVLALAGLAALAARAEGMWRWLPSTPGGATD